MNNPTPHTTLPTAHRTADRAPTPLDHLRPGQRGAIHSIRAYGLLGRRLRDMGLMPGVALEVTGLAPLGDPMSVSLEGYDLSLRSTEAREVWVNVEKAPREVLA